MHETLDHRYDLRLQNPGLGVKLFDILALHIVFFLIFLGHQLFDDSLVPHNLFLKQLVLLLGLLHILTSVTQTLLKLLNLELRL